jgi:hypothetical protein
MTTPRDDRDLDALLRQPAERLVPPDGSWDLINRRARRRKWAKASAAVAAGVIVVAGAVPAVIAVRHNSDDQSIEIANATPSNHVNSAIKTPKPAVVASSPTPTVSTSAPAPKPVSLAGFKPASLSFISKDYGFLIGPTTSRSAVVAETTNDGESWSGLATVPVNGSKVGIRFASGAIGYVFGSKFFMTEDGGLVWTAEPTPGTSGYIDDLETMDQKVWATVSPCQGCSQVQLYEAPIGDPNLRPVEGVPMLQGSDSTLVVSSQAVYLMVHDSTTKQGQLYASPKGTTWVKRTDPCDGQALGTFGTWSTNGLAALCGQGTGSSSPAKILESDNSGKSWTNVGTTSASGDDMITAGSSTSLVISQDGAGAPYVSTGTSKSLSFTGAQTGTSSMGFVGFINISHVVAITSPADTQHAFMTSHDAGATWTVYRFR